MDYFEKYLEAKKCLYKMANQFLAVLIPIEIAKDMGIEISDRDLIVNGVEVCFHNFNSDGILAWDYLGLSKDFIARKEMWDLESNLKNEAVRDDIDYYKEYLKMCILLIDMVFKYYAWDITLEEAEMFNVKYDEGDLDDFKYKVDTCYNLCQGAGESIWNLFDIKDQIVGKSIFLNLRKSYKESLLKANKDKTLKLTKKDNK